MGEGTTKLPPVATPDSSGFDEQDPSPFFNGYLGKVSTSFKYKREKLSLENYVSTLLLLRALLMPDPILGSQVYYIHKSFKILNLHSITIFYS